VSSFRHIVTKDEENIRIDKMLANIQQDRSRSQIQKWIEENFVTVNGKFVKANYKCQVQDQIRWSIPKEKQINLMPENIPLSIIYEDDDLLVVNKPKGMVVHSSENHQNGTLVHALLYHTEKLSQIGGLERPGIVHRLDKDTSGLLVVAKNDETHKHLAKQFKRHEVERTYEAIVYGVIDHNKGIIDAPIGRDPKHRLRMAVVDNGKQAITHFHIIKKYRKYTHISCSLETGRTHQIRVHMKYIRHPLVGDKKYGPRKTFNLNGQALHAKQLGFYHPTTKEWMMFKTDLPNYFKRAMERIRNMY